MDAFPVPEAVIVKLDYNSIQIKRDWGKTLSAITTYCNRIQTSCWDDCGCMSLVFYIVLSVIPMYWVQCTGLVLESWCLDWDNKLKAEKRNLWLEALKKTNHILYCKYWTSINHVTFLLIFTQLIMMNIFVTRQNCFCNYHLVPIVLVSIVITLM